MADNLSFIKQRITAGSKQGGKLYLSEYNGIMWATNKYWVTPAARVAPLLSKYNLASPLCVGEYDVNGNVTRKSEGSVNQGRLLSLDGYGHALAPLEVGGVQAYSRQESGRYLRLYQDGQGVLGWPADDLDWLSQTYDLPCEEDTYYGTVRYMGDGKRMPATAAVVADLIRRVKPSTVTGGEYVPAETENLGPRLIGLIAGFGIGGPA